MKGILLHKSNTIIGLLIFSLAIFWGSYQSVSQTTDTISKPKIGLVLSGGGAKGLAHIGVLKVLEEAGIKPDIITGTSMGSIVGSLYAYGYTADQLSEINDNANWEQLLTDDEQLQKVAMEEKSETKKYLFEIPIRDKKINLPSGLIEGQHLEAYFSELLWPLTSHENFDSLPIPFHCMSVDMISGKTLEHRSGNLVKSIRASMSIPTVFTPVQSDSMLLVDGGVTQNFPVQQAIDMGADIIIGVYVGFEEDVSIEELSDMSEILMRSIALAGILDAREQFKKTDLLVIPDLRKYGAGDFNKGQIIEKIGEEAARKQLSKFKALADSLNLNYKPSPKMESAKRILITGVEVEDLQFLSENYVLSKSGIEPGDTVSHNDIQESIEYMYGTRHFRKLTYSLKKSNKENGYILVFHVKETPRALFKFTPNYDDDLGVGLVTNFTLRNIIVPDSRFLLSVNIAENPGAEMQFNKLLGKNQRFANHFYAKNLSLKLPFYESGNRLGNYKRGYFEGGYGIHYSPGLSHQFGANIFYKFNRLTPHPDFQSIYPEANFTRHRTHEWGYHAFYSINTTDDLYFPKKGTKLKISFSHALSTNATLDLKSSLVSGSYFVQEIDEPYASLVLDYNWYKTFANSITYNFGVGVGLSSDNPGINGLFLLGGQQFKESLAFKNFAGYNFAELYANNYAFLKSGILVQMLPGLYLAGTVNVGNIADAYDGIFDNIANNKVSDYYWGYNLGIKYDSVIGPIQWLMADNNKDGELRFHFSIGFPF